MQITSTSCLTYVVYTHTHNCKKQKRCIIPSAVVSTLGDKVVYVWKHQVSADNL